MPVVTLEPKAASCKIKEDKGKRTCVEFSTMKSIVWLPSGGLTQKKTILSQPQTPEGEVIDSQVQLTACHS